MLDARAEGGRVGRAARGLHAEEPRPARDLARAEQLVEAALGAQHIAAVAERHHHVVGGAEAPLLPQLVGEGLRSFHEEGLPVVARVEDLGALAQGRLRHVLARALDRHHVGAAGRDLGDLGIGRGLRHQDAAGEPGRRGVGRERRPRVARGVLQHPGDPAALEIAHHHGHAAVLEGAGRHHEVELVVDGRAVPFARRAAASTLRPGSPRARRRPGARGRSATPSGARSRCRAA